MNSTVDQIESKLPDFGGRPRKFTDLDEVKAKIQEHFDSLAERWEIVEDYVAKRDRKGNEVIENGEVQYDLIKRRVKRPAEAPTVVGLAMALGTTRQTLLDYEERGLDDDATEFDRGFLDTIRTAKLAVEHYNAQSLATGRVQAAGVIFTMINNHGWKQASEIKTSGEQTVKIGRELNEDELADLVARTVGSSRPQAQGPA